MTRAILIALAAAACSPSPSNEAAPANLSAEAPEAPEATVAATDVPPKPGELKTFRDWTVGCDNGGVCAMASLGPEAGDFPLVTMSVAREGGPRGRWKVALSANDTDPQGVSIDGKRVASGGDDYTGPQAEAIVAAMANGTALTPLDAGGKPMGTISLAGASAALRYIDAMQGRADTVTAAVAKGAKPADAVPQPPALPVIDAVAPGGTAATPTAAQVAEMRKTAGCDTEGFTAEQAAESHALGGGATLVFVPCSSGAYNLSSALFVLKDGQANLARADVPTGFSGEQGTDAPAQVVNGDFDDGLVTSYAKGRGLGDCGVAQEFAWDGTRLRLVEESVMGECRGNTDLITTWRARVVRK